MSAMISLNSLKNDNKNEISQNVNINVNKCSQEDVKVSYDNGKTTTNIDNNHIFDYYDSILPNINNEYYNNLVKVFTLYIDLLNSGKYKKIHGQNVLFRKDYLKIIYWLAKTYITNNEDCNIKIYIDENVGCFVNEYVIDSISCNYKGGFIDIFTKSAEIVNILQLMKIDKQHIINQE